jgi:hypothetical protein
MPAFRARGVQLDQCAGCDRGLHLDRVVAGCKRGRDLDRRRSRRRDCLSDDQDFDRAGLGDERASGDDGGLVLALIQIDLAVGGEADGGVVGGGGAWMDTNP